MREEKWSATFRRPRHGDDAQGRSSPHGRMSDSAHVAWPRPPRAGSSRTTGPSPGGDLPVQLPRPRPHRRVSDVLLPSVVRTRAVQRQLRSPPGAVGAGAFDSTTHISFDVRGGLLIRQAHHCRGQHDVLRDEGEAYARKLTQANVPATSIGINGTLHEFMMLNAVRNTRATDAAMQQAVHTLRTPPCTRAETPSAPHTTVLDRAARCREPHTTPSVQHG